MSGRINEIEYKEITILITDLSQLSAPDAIKVLEETLIKVPTYGPKSVYSLVNVKDMNFSPALINVFGTVAKENSNYVIATAICGLSSMKKLIAKGVISASNRKADFFDLELDGKEWLYLISKGEK